MVMNYTFVSLTGDNGLEELKAHRDKLQVLYDARNEVQRHTWVASGVRANGDGAQPSLTFPASAMCIRSGVVLPESLIPSFTPLAFEELTRLHRGVVAISQNGPCRTVASHRLHIMEQHFDLFKTLNSEQDQFYATREGVRWEETPKVNIAVRAERCMPKARLVTEVAAALRNGADPTLTKMWAQTGYTTVTPETLGVQLESTYNKPHDKFSLERLRRRSEVGGLLRYLLRYDSPHLLHMVEETVRHTPKSHGLDLALTVEGTGLKEWANVVVLAQRVLAHRPDARFSLRLDLTRVPESVSSFEEMLYNVFLPFWCPPDDATRAVLERFVAVQAYSEVVDGPLRVLKSLSDYTRGELLPPEIAIFHVYSNLQVLNSTKRAATSTPPRLQLRYSCGPTTEVWRLGLAYLLSDVIANAVPLWQQPVLAYGAYLHRIGLTISLLGRLSMGTEQVLGHMWKCGMRMTLATEDPLQRYTHHDALMEEVVTARKVVRLSSLDVYEMWGNSFIMSGLEGSEEMERLTRVIHGRAYYRNLVCSHEHSLVRGCGRSHEHDTSRRVGTVRDPHRAVPFTRIAVYGGTMTPTHSSSPAAAMIRDVLRLRIKYALNDSARLPKPGDGTIGVQSQLRLAGGMWTCLDDDVPISIGEYLHDYNVVRDTMNHPLCQHLAARRLEVLMSKFELHVALNHRQENSGESHIDHRDLYHTVKVDTHCHLAAGMTAKELLLYIKDKYKNHGDDVVWSDHRTSLVDLMRKLGIENVDAITVDALDVQADSSIWERFDNFNSKYNPMGQAALREIFLKTDNAIQGRFFSELTKQIFRKNQDDGYIFTEFRLSVYGRKRSEWHGLAKWSATFGMNSATNKWMVQVPRIYHVYRKAGEIQSFGELIDNIFVPLWEVSMDPAVDPDLHNFLRHVSGFDTVDNEAALDHVGSRTAETLPHAWTSEVSPPYWYWMFYLWINIRSLNRYRAAKGLSTFGFRPHCGESGHVNHLIDGLLLATGINHGINLRYTPVLQYMYYLSQIGLALSPLSNNGLFLTYMNNPFPAFFKRGLNVSLSTDDPLQFHHTSEPLIEEYAIASKMWRMSSTDLCEVARYSVLQSGFDAHRKAAWLGPLHHLSSSAGNVPSRSHVPNIRVAFRYETYQDECDYLDLLHGRAEQCPIVRFMLTPEEEEVLVAHHDAALIPSKI
eukprot:PhM_4_TR18466/c0_g1_i1/m.77161/K01490/AMPD; AMP deaminase